MQRARGFSLIELLVVLAVVAFLAFVTVPLASGWIRNAQLEKDFAGVQRALGTTKALAMRNSTGADSGVASAVLCRSGQDLFIFQRTGTTPATAAACSRLALLTPADRPVYHMGQDVAITFGNNNQAFCGASFNSRGAVSLCQGADCSTCTLPFDPATGLSVVVTGADTLRDPNNANNADPNDQSNIIRAF